jgi:hypothetical protein
MKQKMLTFAVLISMLFAVSCSNTPNDVIHNTKTEAVGWVVDKSVSEKPIQKFEDYYQISPTWGQAFHYANKRPDYTLFTVLGLLFVATFAFLFYGKTSDASWLPKFLNNEILFGFSLFITLTAGVVFLTNHAFEVKWQNDKWISKESYDKVVKEAGSTQPIWDSLETNHKIVGGSWK